MKRTSHILLSLTLLCLISCDKGSTRPKTADPSNAVVDNGPYGDFSRWRGIGGDSLFEEELTLSLFYIEKNSPCDICYYQLNYPLWNDYDYVYSTSKCLVSNDTLIITDLATSKKGIFKRINK